MWIKSAAEETKVEDGTRAEDGHTCERCNALLAGAQTIMGLFGGQPRRFERCLSCDFVNWLPSIATDEPEASA